MATCQVWRLAILSPGRAPGEWLPWLWLRSRAGALSVCTARPNVIGRSRLALARLHHAMRLCATRTDAHILRATHFWFRRLRSLASWVSDFGLWARPVPELELALFGG